MGYAADVLKKEIKELQAEIARRQKALDILEGGKPAAAEKPKRKPQPRTVSAGKPSRPAPEPYSDELADKVLSHLETLSPSDARTEADIRDAVGAEGTLTGVLKTLAEKDCVKVWGRRRGTRYSFLGFPPELANKAAE